MQKAGRLVPHRVQVERWVDLALVGVTSFALTRAMQLLVCLCGWTNRGK